MIKNFINKEMSLKDYFVGLKNFAEFVPDMINWILSFCLSFKWLVFLCG